MVNSTDFIILALGGVLTVAFLYRDKLPFIGSPAQKTPVPVKAASGLANGGYQGDVRDFATRMKEQVRSLSGSSRALTWQPFGGSRAWGARVLRKRTRGV